MEYLPKIPGIEFKLIENYNGDYAIGNEGSIYSSKKMCKWVKLSVEIDTFGHQRIQLCKNGIIKHHFIHILVLEAFIGPCPPGMESCHGSNGKYDNSVSNLYWGTHSTNMQDKHRDGTMPKGETHHNAQFTDSEIALMRELHKQGYSQRSIARKFHAGFSTVNRYVRNIVR